MVDTIPKTEPMPKPFICFLNYRQQQHCTRLYNGLYKRCIINSTNVYNVAFPLCLFLRFLVATVSRSTILLLEVKAEKAPLLFWWLNNIYYFCNSLTNGNE